MLRFIIWSLTLMNFMKSGLDLVESAGVKVWLKALKITSVIGAACFLGYAFFLIYQERINNKDVLNCRSTEFLWQSVLLIFIVSIFFFFTVRTQILINNQHEESKEDPEFKAINEHRKQAMDTVWILLVWFSVTTFESVAYSVAVYVLADPQCKLDDTAWWATYAQFMDRITNFQLWLIPLIWFFWPSKANKRNNRSRRRAVDQLKRSTVSKRNYHTSSMINTEGNEDSTYGDEYTYSEDDYSSLDGTEYHENDNRSDLSHNDYLGGDVPALPTSNNGMGFAHNANIFIIGNQQDGGGDHRTGRLSSSGIDSKNYSFYLGDRPSADQKDRNANGDDTASYVSDSEQTFHLQHHASSKD